MISTGKTLKALLLSAALAFAAAGPANAERDAAIKAYEMGRFDEALVDFRARAAEGDEWAQYHRGMMYKDGLGVAADRVYALAWFMCVSLGGGELSEPAARWQAQLESSLRSLKKAEVAAARIGAAPCAVAPEGEADAAPRTVDFEAIQQALADGDTVNAQRVKYDWSPSAKSQIEGGKAPLLALPSRDSILTKVFFLPADATIVGAQYVAEAFGAYRLFRDLREFALEGHTAVSMLIALLWWVLISKVLWSVSHTFYTTYRST